MLDDAFTTPADRRTTPEWFASLVRAHQEELLRCAHLLSGDAERTERLAEEALLAALREQTRDDGERDWRTWLLHTLAVRYLNEPGGVLSRPIATVPDATTRYQVDDERSRLWAAMARCDAPQRLALVLSDFNRLDPESVRELTRWTPAELRQRLETARQRLRDAAGARQEASAHALLLTLALDAPRVDLWARLEGPARRLAEREQRRRRAWTGALLASVAVIALAGALWLGGWLADDDTLPQQAVAPPSVTVVASTPTPPGPTSTPALERPVADVPDLHLLSATVDGDRQTLLVDESGAVRATLEGHPEQTALSPDGRWLVSTRVEGFGNAERVYLSAIDTVTAVVWEREIEGSSGRLGVMNAQVVVIEAGPSRARSPRLAAYDLSDGRELARWTLAPHPSIGRWARTDELHLYPAADGVALHLVAFQIDHVTGLAVRAVHRYGPTDATLEPIAQEELTITRGRWGPAFDFWSARPTPDGRALYSLSDDGLSASLRFFDLDTAAVTSIELPASVGVAGERWDAASSVLSHDGRWLYMVARSGEVLTVDLVERRQAWRFPLDLNGVVSQPPGGAQWSWGWEGGVFSPDGSRLYLLHAFAGSSTLSDPEAATVLWEIDVAQWRVLREWRVPGLVETLTLDPRDGRPLLVTQRADLERGGGTTAMYVLDSAAGQLLDAVDSFDVAAETPEFQLLPLRRLYVTQFGRTPLTAGLAMRDLPSFATLPLLDLSIERAVLAAEGQAVFELRLLDPASLSPARPGAPGVRLDPAAAVTLTLSQPGLSDYIVIPVQVEPGVYRASLPLNELGSWGVTATVSFTDGTRWSAQWPGAVQVNPVYQADDGRAYMLMFWLVLDPAMPAMPAVGEEALFTATFIDVGSGQQLPAGVTLEIGLPEEVDVLFRREDGAFKTVTLLPLSHGAYGASSSFRWAGFWPAELSFRTNDGTLTLPAGTFQVLANET